VTKLSVAAAAAVRRVAAETVGTHQLTVTDAGRGSSTPSVGLAVGGGCAGRAASLLALSTWRRLVGGVQSCFVLPSTTTTSSSRRSYNLINVQPINQVTD